MGPAEIIDALPTFKEIPADYRLPLLVMHQDQCSVGWAASQYLGSMMSLLIALFGDIFHREWNSTKLACKRTKQFLWGTIVQLTVFFNSSRAPWGSQTFWRVKQDALNHLESAGTISETFTDMLPEVCKELQLPIPRTNDGLKVLVSVL